MNTMTDAQNLFRKALRLHQAGRIEDAEPLYNELLREHKNHEEALHLLGLIRSQQNDHLKAIALITRAVEIDPGFAVAHYNLGRCYEQIAENEKAIRSYSKSLSLQPGDADCHLGLGSAQLALRRFDEALGNFDKAIALNANFVEAHNNRGIALKKLARLDEALASYDKAVALNPQFVEAHNNRGKVLKELKRPDEALASYDRAIALDAKFAQAHYNRGFVLLEFNRLDEALASYDKAISLNPELPRAHYVRGFILTELMRLEEALASYDRAIALNPKSAEAHNNRGLVLKKLERPERALASFNRAIALDPEFCGAYDNRGKILKKLNRPDEALASYGKAIALDPSYAFLAGTILHLKQDMCSWEDFTADVEKLSAGIIQDLKVTNPFPVLALCDSRSLQLKAAQTYTESSYTPTPERAVFRRGAPSEQITIGYFSADFHNHATTQLMAELFENHDRDRFRLIAYSFGPEATDQMRERIKSSFDEFHDVRSMTDQQLVKLSRHDCIDIAIDLKGFTHGSRTGVFASRAAPLQVNFIGYPGTMGADYYDYLIADRMLIPDSHKNGYTEKIVYLPHSYQPNDRQRKIADKAFARAELGLPEDAFVFCCFNNTYKITPPVFDVWMELLRAVEKSVLWLFESNKFCGANLRKEARQRGVDPDRLVFAKHFPLEEHLARHKCADLFLDTLPCNAHTTASDALWAGLPLLTQIGEAFAGRVAASLLNAVELPELVVASKELYRQTAIDLARNPERLGSLKEKLAHNRLTAPLFDSALFTKNIEAAYVAMYERYHSGLKPDHIYIEAVGSKLEKSVA